MTDSSPIATLHLNDLCQTKPERPGWSLTFGATCAEAAAVCLVTRDIQNVPHCKLMAFNLVPSNFNGMRSTIPSDASTPIRKLPLNTEHMALPHSSCLASPTSPSLSDRLKEKALALISGLAPLTIETPCFNAKPAWKSLASVKVLKPSSNPELV